MSEKNTIIKNLKEDHDEYITLLKLSPSANLKIFDHYSCCEFCNCDCTAESIRLSDMKCLKDPNNNICCADNYNENPIVMKKLSSGRKKKIKKIKRPKSIISNRSYTKDCAILNELLNLELPKNSNRKQRVSKKRSEISLNVTEFPPCQEEFNDLCKPMLNLCLSPRTRQAYNKIPVHDKRILNRMAQRRNERAITNENAFLAQKLWENERFERDISKFEQDEEYRKAVREKQLFDNEMTRSRIEAITKRNKEEIQRLQDELLQKDFKLQDRLKRIKLDKAIKVYQRNQEMFRKIESVQLTQDELHFDNAIRRQEICNRYEKRLQEAECMRNQQINSYLKRIKHANYMQQLIHEQNFKEIDKFEKMRNEQIREEIARKANRIKQFIKKKQQNYNDLLERAKISANLRDLVRNSVSPDGTQQYLNTVQQSNSYFKAPFNDRPISDLSFQSSVRLG